MEEKLRPADPLEALREMGLDEALAHVGNVIYQAAIVIEGFENAGKVNGNGHHAAQAVALNAQVELLRRWKNQDEVVSLSATHPAAQELNQHARL